MDELEKIIQDYCGYGDHGCKDLAQKIRDAGYHRHESEYCSCEETKDEFGGCVPNETNTKCIACHKSICPTPKRKRIKKIDIDCTSPELVNKINEISDRLDENHICMNCSKFIPTPKRKRIEFLIHTHTQGENIKSCKDCKINEIINRIEYEN